MGSPRRDLEESSRWGKQDGADHAGRDREMEQWVHLTAGDAAGLPVHGDVIFSITALCKQSKSQEKRVPLKAASSAACRDEGGDEQQTRKAAAGAVFELCFPQCHHVPYSSLTMFLGGTQGDRDSATAYSKCLCPEPLSACIPGRASPEEGGIRSFGLQQAAEWMG